MARKAPRVPRDLKDQMVRRVLSARQGRRGRSVSLASQDILVGQVTKETRVPRVETVCLETREKEERKV